MAKNWTVVEALEALKNFDKAAIMDFGKRFPLATNALAKAENIDDFVAGLPEHVTMRKIDANLKEGVEPYVDEDEEGEAPKKSNRGRKPKTAKTEDEKKAAAKARREARKAKKAAETEEDDEDEVEDDEPEDISDEEDYSSMNALELFKLCKKRGIKAEPKQKSSVYIKLLKAADAASDEDEAEDDWSDDEDEEEAPAPAPKKGRGRPAKAAKEDKPAKKETKKPVEDDEDDWDI